MKNSINLFTLIIGSLICVSSISQPVKFIIKGRLVNQSTSEKIFLQGDINVELPLTSEKKFFYTGSLSKPGLFLIKTDHSYAWAIWINEGQIEINLEEYNLEETANTDSKKLLRVISISGQPETEKYQWFIDYQNRLSKMYHGLPSGHSKDSVVKYYYPTLKEYIYNHPASSLSFALVDQFKMDRAKKDTLVSLLNRNVNPDELKEIEKSIARERMLATGNTVTDFQQPSLDGKSFSLSTISSKYILIEFWSSSCIPCRKSNPKLIELYKKYNRETFEIVGISLDDSKSQWLNAVEKDKIPWIQVSDLKGWKNELALKYLVGAIPFNILIDSNRKVLATDLNNEALADKLSSL